MIAEWKKQYEMVQLNVVAMMQLTHCFLNPMIGQGHGKILNMSSVAAFSAGPYMSIYYATKEFVRSFSEAIAEEVKGTGVTVTAFTLDLQLLGLSRRQQWVKAPRCSGRQLRQTRLQRVAYVL